jgi:hypothetical protein
MKKMMLGVAFLGSLLIACGVEEEVESGAGEPTVIESELVGKSPEPITPSYVEVTRWRCPPSGILYSSPATCDAACSQDCEERTVCYHGPPVPCR